MTTSTHIDITPYLEQIGLTVLKVQGPEAICLCPNHADTKGKFAFNQAMLIGHCWVCDFRVPSLDALAAHMTGRPADPDVVTEARTYSLNDAVGALSRAKTKALDPARVLEYRYKQFKPMPNKLLEFRRLSADVAGYYGVKFSTIRHCWVLPITTPAGKLIGWQERQRGGFSNYPKGVPKSGTLFGLHLFNSDRVVLVESPLDAVRVNQALGVAAVASFGAEVSNAQIELLCRHCSEVTVALDNDEPGQKAAERVLYQLRKRTGAVPWRYEGREKDPGEYRTDEEITEAWRRTRRYGL